MLSHFHNIHMSNKSHNVSVNERGDVEAAFWALDESGLLQNSAGNIF